METHFRPDISDAIRLSESPGRSPQINQGLTSPVRSVHPMESLHSQADFGLRTTDFFDDTSDNESVNFFENSRQPAPTSEPFVSQCESKTKPSGPDSEGYQRLAPVAPNKLQAFADLPSSSFNGSVEELLPGEQHISPPQFTRATYVPSNHTPRSSTQIERPEERQASISPTKVDQMLGAHAIAHEITLQALMRDEDMLEESLRSFAPLQAGDRTSLLPPTLRKNDPRSPRDRTFSSPAAAANKKVHVVPPPIDTSGQRRSIPADLVRTPYPFEPQRIHRKDFGRSPTAADTVPLTTHTESILTLSIRRSNPHSRPRVTTMTVPASNDFSVLRSNTGENERHFKALDFDDEEFFRQLRHSYHELMGPLLWLSARSLRRIKVSGPATQAADAGYGWLQQPRSPRMLAYKGLSDTFGEDRILQQYRSPGLGKSRYAFVHWAHRLSAAPPLHTPQTGGTVEDTNDRELVRKIEQPEGLEFIVSWSAVRILAALAVVLQVSIVAALLWVFLGRSTVPTLPGVPPHGGFRDAGDRVTSGVLMGICVLLIGLSGIAGWLGVSWLVM